MKKHRNIKLIAWFNFLLDFRPYSVIAILYFAHVAGSYALAMAVFSLTMFSASVFEIPTGIFSDFYGRKKTVVLGSVFSILAISSYAMGAYHFLLIGAILEGISRSLYSGNNDALLYDSLLEHGQEKEYSHYLGKVSAMFQFALALSAIIGSIVGSWSFSLILWLSVIPQVLCLLIALQLIEPRTNVVNTNRVIDQLKEAYDNFISNKKLRSLSIASVWEYAIGEASFQFEIVFINLLWPTWAIGFIRAASYAGGSISFFISGRMIKRFNELRLLIVGKLYGFVSTVTALSFPSIFSPLIMATNSLFFGIMSVSENTLMQKEFLPHQRSTMRSLNSLAGSVAFAIISLGIGYVADLVGPIRTLIYAQILAFPVTLIYLQLYRKHAR